jgi:ABC-2 type transport system permease protein
MIEPEVRLLMGKELRQLVASRTAILTGTFTPLLMLVGVPWLTSLADKPSGKTKPLSGPSFGLIAEIGDDPRRIGVALLPMMVALSGLVVPMMMATYLLIIERERRTLELLVAMPVRIEQVLRAKLAAVVLVSSLITGPLLLLDVIFMPIVGVAKITDVIALPVLLVCAMAFSTAASLLMALIARDMRTANNVGGAIIVPALLLTVTATVFLPGGPVRPLAIAGLYFIAALVFARIVSRSVTYERLLS